MRHNHLKNIVCIVVLTLAWAASACAAPVVLKLTRLGPTYVDKHNNFAETQRFSVRAVYAKGSPQAGEVAQELNAKLRVEEWRTGIYDGLYGATRLPMKLNMRNGRAQFTLRSLARYTLVGQRNAPEPEVAVFLGKHYVRARVPQWVDANGDDQIDWLQQRVASLVAKGLHSASPEVRKVLQSVDEWQQSYRGDCGGVLPESPTVVQIGAACLNQGGVNTHRTNMNGELAATILHEARHVWVYRHPDLARLPLVYSPGRSIRADCRARNMQDCRARFSLNEAAVAVHEKDAETFAERYKGYLQ